MSTKLRDATKSVRKYLYIAGGIVVIIIMLSWIGGGVNPPPLANNPNNSNYPPANKLLNNIPRPVITSIKIAEDSPALVAKTSQKFPEFPNVINVYKIKPEREYAGEADSARETAKLLNFTREENKVINNVMYWETPDRNRFLQYDKAQRLWNYRYSTYPIVSNEALKNNADDYINIANSFFSALRISSENISATKGRAEFIKISPQGLIDNSSSEPNAVKVQLFKNIVGIKPVINEVNTPLYVVRKYKYTDGIVNAIINGQGKLVHSNLLQLSYKNLSYAESGIYNIITADEAFVKIQAKEGFLYRVVIDNRNEFEQETDIKVQQFRLDVSKTQLIYIEPESVNLEIAWTNYLQPFYLFEGTFQTTSGQNGQCAFIVPALQSDNYL